MPLSPYPRGGSQSSLRRNRLDLGADNGLAFFTYAAEPGSRSEEALKLLGSRVVATLDPADPACTIDQNRVIFERRIEITD